MQQPTVDQTIEHLEQWAAKAPDFRGFRIERFRGQYRLRVSWAHQPEDGEVPDYMHADESGDTLPEALMHVVLSPWATYAKIPDERVLLPEWAWPESDPL